MAAPSLEAAQGRERPWIGWAAIVVLFVALWALSHPYFGIHRDGRFYFLQALHSLDPAAFANDLYFKYGSQDQFTLFTYLYRPLVAAFSPNIANSIGSVIAACAWLAGLACFAGSMSDLPRTRWVVMAAVIAASSWYGAGRIFAYGEAALTPRIFAEGFVLGALAAATTGRRVVCALALIVAAILHPLIAAPGIGVALLIFAFKHPRVWFVIAAGGAVVAIAAVTGLRPFDRLLIPMDSEWLAIVHRRSAFAFLTDWGPGDWERFAIVPLGIAAGAIAEPRIRSLLAAVSITVIAGLLADFVGGDMLHSTLVINLQLWRALWIATVVSNACWPIAALKSQRGSISHDLLWFTILASIGSRLLPYGDIPALIAAVSGLGAFAYESRYGPVHRLARLVLLAGPALTLVWITLVFFSQLTVDPTLTLLSICLSAGCLYLLLSTRRIRAILKLAMALLVCVVSFATIDQRTAWDRYVESGHDSPDLIDFTKNASNIYWEADPKLVWIKLHRNQYFSCAQGTGAMFFRQTAIEYQRRAKSLAGLGPADFGSSDTNYLCPVAQFDVKIPKEALVKQACEANPDLDAIILTTPIQALPGRVWKAPVPRILSSNGKVTNVTNYYRYDCPTSRSGAAGVAQPAVR